jgi:ligand-binding SRPBCC domain-containing protein
MKIFFKTRVKASFPRVRDGFDFDLFKALIPPWTDVTHDRFDGCKEGDEIHFTAHRLGLKVRWVSLITFANHSEAEWSFIDEGKMIPFPLKYWRHLHRVVRVSDTKTDIIDDIEYRCYTKSLEKLVYPLLWATIAIRPRRYRQYFEDVKK